VFATHTTCGFSSGVVNATKRRRGEGNNNNLKTTKDREQNKKELLAAERRDKAKQRMTNKHDAPRCELSKAAVNDAVVFLRVGEL
jgi:hypothetical protein